MARASAKTRFSELLSVREERSPDNHELGDKVAVLESMADWRRVEQPAAPFRTLKDWLLAPEPKFELPTPKWRRHVRLRRPPTFDD